jgi:hypothetical protein
MDVQRHRGREKGNRKKETMIKFGHFERVERFVRLESIFQNCCHSMEMTASRHLAENRLAEQHFVDAPST